MICFFIEMWNLEDENWVLGWTRLAPDSATAQHFDRKLTSCSDLRTVVARHSVGGSVLLPALRYRFSIR